MSSERRRRVRDRRRRLLGHRVRTRLEQPRARTLTKPNAVAHCLRLGESGFTDWRLPTADGLADLAEHGPSAHISKPRIAWSSTDGEPGRDSALLHSFGLHKSRAVDKHKRHGAICVR